MIEVKTGYAIIDEKLSFIKSISDKGVVCYRQFGVFGGGHCERIESFQERKIEYLDYQEGRDMYDRLHGAKNWLIK